MIFKIDANANLSKSKPKADREKWTKTLEIASVYLLSETSFTFSLFFLGHCQSSVTSKGHKLTGRRLWCTTRRQEEHTHKHTYMSYIDIKTFRNTPNISDFKVGVNRQKAGIFLVFVVFDCNLKMASVSFQMRSHLLHWSSCVTDSVIETDWHLWQLSDHPLYISANYPGHWPVVSLVIILHFAYFVF